MTEYVAAWRDAHMLDLTVWTVQIEGGPQMPLSPGQPWPLDHTELNDRPVLFRCTLTVPPGWGEHLELLLDLGGEGLVRVLTSTAGQVYQGGLNRYHRRVPLGEQAVGAVLQIEAEVVPRGLFGSPTPRPHLELAQLCEPQPDVVQLHTALQTIAAAVRVLGASTLNGQHPGPESDADREVAERLLNLTEQVLKRLDWPSAAQDALARLPLMGGGESFTSGLWSVPTDRPEAQPLPTEVLKRAARADAELRTGLLKLANLFPPRGRLALSGHAHLDLGWLWPVHETRRKGRRTLSTVLELMERHPNFIFNQSSAQLYAWMQEDDPALFEAIQARVQEGRFEPVGGMWVEPDCQMSGGEALARHLLYGQEYFRKTFGRTCTVAWLPDTFGFTPGLPQLLLAAGMNGFFTTKINWNEETVFPYDLYQWEGLDGSRVLAHTLYNPAPGGYNGDIAPLDVLGTWRSYKAKALPAWGTAQAERVLTFGYGDGGGGPTTEMLGAYDLLRCFPAMPALHMTRIDDLFARLPTDLPVWVGELYLELHRGTLTSQARTKRGNRLAEHRLLEAEAFCALAGQDQQAELEDLWKVTLLNQFHDILPGSSIREVYETALPELEDVQQRARTLLETGQTAEAGTFTVLNAANWDRPLRVLLPAAEGGVTLEDGTPLPVQSVAGGQLVHAPSVLVPAFGQLRLKRSPGAEVAMSGSGVTARRDSNGTVLENTRVRATFSPDGTLTGLRDLSSGAEFLGPLGHRLMSYPDLPYAWEAWDVAHGLDVPGKPPIGEVVRGEVDVTLQEGTLETTLTVRRRWRSSTVTQVFALRTDSGRLDVRLHLDWHERRTLLRAVTDVNVLAREAWYETALGAQARTIHQNTPFDAAHFEVSAHRWADVSQPGRGLSVLNDGRYGHSALSCGPSGSELSLSLVRGPMWPDPQADLGEHQLTYALYPHAGDWRRAHTTREGFDLNSPLTALPGTRPPGPALKLSGLPLMLSALKRAEVGNDLILRLYEPHGMSGAATIALAGLTRAERVNLLEDTGEALSVQSRQVTLDIRPFELLTLRLKRDGADRNNRS
ncbi:glycosyl hydrolase-related protein (plasmid) [Deinococcus sp. KNUC1210]|uniref:alpha-mannosidase n=1 Tax=Deinococcus sp. KNUC1210 TaxID=2917691 RepID=UPI001EF15639|nr:glycoside hydrolase family 38 C-terminal domain-containing protein [Deinococcus sp. KNUC1210]ULH18024.1 glycosyl hydrolase-related protein [Deinococcus sp. KNUC1210]